MAGGHGGAGPGGIRNRTVPLVQYMRKTHPTTPIVLAEGTESGSGWVSDFHEHDAYVDCHVSTFVPGSPHVIRCPHAEAPSIRKLYLHIMTSVTRYPI